MTEKKFETMEKIKEENKKLVDENKDQVDNIQNKINELGKLVEENAASITKTNHVEIIRELEEKNLMDEIKNMKTVSNIFE